MTSLYDGLAGVLNDIFGAPVKHTTKAGVCRELRGVFRREPDEYVDDEGRAVVVVGPSLRLQKSDAANVKVGDVIEIEGGARFQVTGWRPNISPAADAFILFDLEAVELSE